MALFIKDLETLTNNTIDFLINNTDITNISPGSTSRLFSDAINTEISDLYIAMDTNHRMAFLSTAEGIYLDLIGQSFNLYRQEGVRNTVGAESQNIKFYVLTGTLSEAMESLNYIAEGTLVTNIDGSIVYRVDHTTLFLDEDTEVYVSATAINDGTEANVSSNELIRQNLGFDNVFVTNTAPLMSGSDRESDDNFRARIAKATISLQKANRTAVEQGILELPEVADVIMKHYVRGIGTFDVYVLSTSGFPSEELLNIVQEKINEIQGVGISGLAKSPRKLYVDITAKLIFKDNIDDTTQYNLRRLTTTVVLNYLSSIPMGGSFVYNELIQRIMEVSTDILDTNIIIYKFRDKDSLRININAEFDEVFIPNETVSDAVKVI